MNILSCFPFYVSVSGYMIDSRGCGRLVAILEQVVDESETRMPFFGECTIIN